MTDAIPPRRCQYKGCAAPLQSNNHSSVCALHKHSYACTCTACLQRRTGPQDSQFKRVARVAVIGTTPSEVRRVPVSLPREPWS